MEKENKNKVTIGLYNMNQTILNNCLKEEKKELFNAEVKQSLIKVRNMCNEVFGECEYDIKIQ